jgi:hypothetical protein
MLILDGNDDASWATESVKRLREKCRSDPLFLAREVMGKAYAAANGGVNYFETPAPYHYEVNEVLKNRENAIILAPRGHLKTEFITICGTIHFLLVSPNHRVLIMSETPKTARKALRSIMYCFEENHIFRQLFPEYRVDTSEEGGTQNHMDLPNRRGPKGDFSLMVIGVSGATAGGHFDRIVTTDIVSDKTVPPAVTIETMAKTTARVNTLEPLLNKSNKRSHIIIEGTIWSLGDPYCMVLSNPGYSHFKKIVYSCWEKKDGVEVLDENGKRKPMWPILNTTEDLERIRSKDEYHFSAYYENDPQPASEDRLFLPSFFKSYMLGEPGVYPDGIQRARANECPCCGGSLTIRVTADLAISQAKTADWTSLPVSGVCPRGSPVVLALNRGRWTPYETVEKLYELDKLWRPSFIGIESVAWQKAMIHILHEKAKESGYYPLPVWEMFPDNSPNGKIRRISMFAALVASRGLWVRPGDHDVLVDECLRMSRHGSLGGHDDTVDAISYIAQWMDEAEGPVIDVPVDRPLLMGASCINGQDALDMLARRARRLGGAIS